MNSHLNVLDNLDDDALWQFFKKGDLSAFELIYKRNVNQLINYGYKITANRDLIQDCAQDLFVELWEGRENLSDARSIKYYLLKSLRYKLVRRIQENSTQQIGEEELESTEDNFEFHLLHQETATTQIRQLGEALKRLPKRQQEAVHLRYFQELSNEEVAKIMGVNYQSACKFIYSGLKTLRDLMRLSSLIPVLVAFFARQ